MTVRELIEALEKADPDAPVIAPCESGCDPHPVASVFVGKASVTVYPNTFVDINPYTGKPRSEDPVDEDDEEE